VPLLEPQPLNDLHELGDFFSGVGSLDDWLKKRARPNQVSGASRTFVVADNRRVVGYYKISGYILSGKRENAILVESMSDPIDRILQAFPAQFFRQVDEYARWTNM
jgi:hypothetical protein